MTDVSTHRRLSIGLVTTALFLLLASCASSTTSVANVDVDTTAPVSATATVPPQTEPTATTPPAPTATPAPTAPPASASAPTEPPSSSLITVVEELVGDDDGGAIVLRHRNDTTEVVAVGTADATGRDLTRETPMRVGSISKPFIAVMIMQLVEEGAIDLDSPLSTWLPDTPIGPDRTIDQLLGHRSGLPSYTDSPDFVARLFAGLEDPGRVDTPADVLALVVGREPSTPGRFQYSNTNYVLLGQVIEAVDGVAIDESLRERIVQPLGLVSTRFDIGASSDSPALAQPFWSPFMTGEPDTEYTFISSGAGAAGALISTADDLLVFMSGLAAGGLVSDASFALLTDFSNGPYGYGLVPASFEPGSEGFGHGGAIPGFHSTMAYDPDSGEAIVVLTNNEKLVADTFVPTILLDD